MQWVEGNPISGSTFFSYIYKPLTSPPSTATTPKLKHTPTQIRTTAGCDLRPPVPFCYLFSFQYEEGYLSCKLNYSSHQLF